MGEQLPSLFLFLMHWKYGDNPLFYEWVRKRGNLSPPVLAESEA